MRSHSRPNHKQAFRTRSLDGEALDLVTHGADLASELAALVGGDASSDHGAGDTAGSAQVHLARHVDVGGVLVLG